MSKQQLWPLTGPAGNLQAVLEIASTPSFIAVVCHPHPLFGGTMENKVVTTLTRAARDTGAAALRFNFRGVGESDGSYSDGVGECEDLLAAIYSLRRHYPGLPLWLAGFSFGSYVAARTAVVLQANQQAATHLLLVAPPVHHFDFTALTDCGCAVTVVQGDDDEVVDAQEVGRWAGSSPLAPDLIRVPHCTHFFHGQLGVLSALAKTRFPGA